MKPHVESPDCWCEPYLYDKSERTGREHWVHQASRSGRMECEDGSRIVFANFGSAPSVRVVDVFSTRIVNDDAG